MPSLQSENPTLLHVLSGADLFESKGQIRRLISQGAIKLDGEKVLDPDLEANKIKENAIIKAGKKIFIRVIP